MFSRTCINLTITCYLDDESQLFAFLMQFLSNSEYLDSLGYAPLNLTELSLNSTLLITTVLSAFFRSKAELTPFANLTTAADALDSLDLLWNSTHSAFVVPINETTVIPIAIQQSDLNGMPINGTFDGPIEYSMEVETPYEGSDTPQERLLNYVQESSDYLRLVYNSLISNSSEIDTSVIDYVTRLEKYRENATDPQNFLTNLGLDEVNYTYLEQNSSKLFNTAVNSLYGDYGQLTDFGTPESICYMINFYRCPKYFTNPFGVYNSTHKGYLGPLNATHLGVLRVSPQDFVWSLFFHEINGTLDNYTASLPQWLANSSYITKNCDNPTKAIIEFLHEDEYETRIAYNEQLAKYGLEFSLILAQFYPEESMIDSDDLQFDLDFNFGDQNSYLDSIGVPRLNNNSYESNSTDLLQLFASYLFRAYAHLSPLANETNIEDNYVHLAIQNSTHTGFLQIYDDTHFFVPYVSLSRTNGSQVVDGPIDQQLWHIPEYFPQDPPYFFGLLQTPDNFLELHQDDPELRIWADKSLLVSDPESPDYGSAPICILYSKECRAKFSKPKQINSS